MAFIIIKPDDPLSEKFSSVSYMEFCPYFIVVCCLQDFLLLEELEESLSVIRPLKRPKPQDCKVTAYNVSARWTPVCYQIYTSMNHCFVVRYTLGVCVYA